MYMYMYTSCIYTYIYVYTYIYMYMYISNATCLTHGLPLVTTTCFTTCRYMSTTCILQTWQTLSNHGDP